MRTTDINQLRQFDTENTDFHRDCICNATFFIDFTIYTSKEEFIVPNEYAQLELTPLNNKKADRIRKQYSGLRR